MVCRNPGFSGECPPIRRGGGGQGDGRTSPRYLHHPSPWHQHRGQSWLRAGRREVGTWTHSPRGPTFNPTSDNSTGKIQKYIICNCSPQPSDRRLSRSIAGSDIIAAESGSWRDSSFLQPMWGRGELTVRPELDFQCFPSFIKRWHQTLPAWVVMPTVWTVKGRISFCQLQKYV